MKLVLKTSGPKGPWVRIPPFPPQGDVLKWLREQSAKLLGRSALHGFKSHLLRQFNYAALTSFLVRAADKAKFEKPLKLIYNIYRKLRERKIKMAIIVISIFLVLLCIGNCLSYCCMCTLAAKVEKLERIVDSGQEGFDGV